MRAARQFLYDTDDLAEGSVNLWHTTARARSALSATSPLAYDSVNGIFSITQSAIDHGSIGGLSDDDHTQYVLRSILTTNGDLFTRTAGAIARLGVGSANQLLGVSGGLPAWVAQSTLDHGSIGGLSDDDHTQYVLRSILTTNGDLFTRIAGVVDRLAVGSANQLLGVSGGLPAWVAQSTIDHGSIGGLADDDHTQYTRADGTRAFTGHQSMGGNRLTTLGTPSASADAATKGYVDALVQGLDWQQSVLDKSLTSPPGSPSSGDRYIVAATGSGAWAGHDWDIATYNGSSWDFTDPNEGFAAWVEDENLQYVWNGSAWVTFGSTSDHGALTGLGDDDHTQYLLVAGSRGLSANWDAGSFEIRAQTFQSDVATGTAPLIVASTTKVDNFNADLLDGQSGAFYQDSANFTGINWGDLTDGGATTLHKHDHGGMDGLGDDDHPQYVLRSILTTDGDLFIRASSAIARLGVGSANQLLGVSSGLPAWVAQSTLDHGSIGGLSDDDHAQYALLAGRSGGQTLRGGTAAGDDLTLSSTANASKGTIFFGSASAYDEVNDRFGVGITVPVVGLDVRKDTNFGVDGTGVDVTFFGDTAGRSILWDQSEDALRVADNVTFKWGAGGAGGGLDYDFALWNDGSKCRFKLETADSALGKNGGVDFQSFEWVSGGYILGLHFTNDVSGISGGTAAFGRRIYCQDFVNQSADAFVNTVARTFPTDTGSIALSWATVAGVGTFATTTGTSMRIQSSGQLIMFHGTGTPTYALEFNADARFRSSEECRFGGTGSGDYRGQIFWTGSVFDVGMGRHPTANTAGGGMRVYAGGATSGATDKNGGDLTLESGTATGNGGSDVIVKAVLASQGAGTTDRSPAELARWKNKCYGVNTASPSAAVHARANAAATEALRAEVPPATTTDSPALRWWGADATTTNNTQTTLATITIPSSTTVGIRAVVVARRTGGTAGTAEDGARYELLAAVKNVSGTATLIGSVTQVAVHEDQAGWDATIDVTGATARVRVTGATDNNIDWHVFYELCQINT